MKYIILFYYYSSWAIGKIIKFVGKESLILRAIASIGVSYMITINMGKVSIPGPMEIVIRYFVVIIVTDVYLKLFYMR